MQSKVFLKHRLIKRLEKLIKTGIDSLIDRQSLEIDHEIFGKLDIWTVGQLGSWIVG